MVVPLVASPGTYRRVVETLVAPFGGSVGDWPVVAVRSRLLVAGVFGTLTIIALARGYARATDRRGWRRDAGETSLLWVVFLTVPPVLAVGAYFCLWHSVRHVARVVLLDERSVADIAGWRWGRPLVRFGLEAAVPTVLALAFVAGLWRLTAPATTLASVTGLSPVAVAVLTVPHTVVVLALDREQGVWSRPG